MDADGENQHRLANGRYQAWSPDGRKIVFNSNQWGQGIYVMDDDGRNLRKLTNHGADNNPTWSPDGREIIFESVRDGKWEDRNWEIYVMDADGENVRRLTKHPARDLWPDWVGESVRPVSSAGKQMITWGWLRHWVLDR